MAHSFPSNATAARVPASRRVFRPQALRNAGFVLFSLAAVAAAYVSTPESPALAALVVVAVSTAAAMHARLAMGRWPAVAQTVLCAALLAFIGAAPPLAGAVLVGGLAGEELIAPSSGRSGALRAGTWTGMLAGLASLSGLAAVPMPVNLAVREVLGAAAGGVLSAPLVLTFGPVAERLFGHTTRLLMSEWLSYEHPLLRELASTAPGTFQHSINVGILADAATGAIRGDTLLARLGGLYHDVGKMRAPGYFIENQGDGPNPHDNLSPPESACIIRAHVTDGVELIEARRMGDRIVDFVREHHGTGVMRLFKERAEALHLTDDGEETYRYPGPRPRSRETGIVMIADQLEATARAAPPDDKAACEEMVCTTIDRIQADQELEDSGLAQRDLLMIQPAFARALQAMYHRRLTYPPPGAQVQPSRKFTLVPRRLGRRRGA